MGTCHNIAYCSASGHRVVVAVVDGVRRVALRAALVGRPGRKQKMPLRLGAGKLRAAAPAVLPVQKRQLWPLMVLQDPWVQPTDLPLEEVDLGEAFLQARASAVGPCLGMTDISFQDIAGGPSCVPLLQEEETREHEKSI